jgi:predicted nucleotidyltransferase
MVTIAEISAFTQRIAEAYQPRQVILFGSHATGEARADSDVDLLVVMPHAGRGWETAADMYQRLQPVFALDLLVRSPEEIQNRLHLGDDFVRGILEQGRVLYEAGDE